MSILPSARWASGEIWAEIFLFFSQGLLLGWCLFVTVLILKNLDTVEISSSLFRTFRKLACMVIIVFIWISVLGLTGLLLKNTVTSIFFAVFLMGMGLLCAALTLLPRAKKHRTKSPYRPY
jgi:quinol-cytochrome oxidoreductase complex cytochrome b subunit